MQNRVGDIQHARARGRGRGTTAAPCHKAGAECCRRDPEKLSSKTHMGLPSLPSKRQVGRSYQEIVSESSQVIVRVELCRNQESRAREMAASADRAEPDLDQEPNSEDGTDE